MPALGLHRHSSLRIRRDLRQITWMAAAVIILELILLVQPFSD